MNYRICLLVLAVAIAAAPFWAQSRPTAAGAGPMTDAGVTNLPGQPFGPHDLIAISVYDAPEFTRTLRIAADGSLRLPMVKRRIEAGGLLPLQLEAAIAAALVEEGLFVKPAVVVTAVEYASRPVSVMGAVRRPLTFQAVGRLTLLEALARAEGLSPDAGPEVLLTRQGASGNEVLRIPVRGLLQEARPELNHVLRGGEEIRVPEARRVFVTGNVKRPGGFPVREEAELTVLKALALAEGLSAYTQKRAYIYRPREGGSPQEIPVELARIMERKAPDVPLLPEDVLYVPEDRGKRNTLGVVEKITGFGASTASGVLIFRR